MSGPENKPIEIFEQEKTTEITVDSETRYWVDFWTRFVNETVQQIHKDEASPIIEIDDEEIKKAIENIFEKTKEAFGKDARIGFIPKGVSLERLMDFSRRQGVGCSWNEIHKSHIREDMSKRSAQAFVFGYQSRQNPEEGTLGAKYPAEWEETDETYMNPYERLTAGIRWFLENGSKMDEENTATLCPGSRFSTGVPLIWNTIGGLNIASVHEGRYHLPDEKSQSWYGVRPVIRQEI